MTSARITVDAQEPDHREPPEILDLDGTAPTGPIRPVSGLGGAPVIDECHTIHAVRLSEFGDVLKAHFRHRVFGSSRRRRLVLADLDGPSTAGGRLARRSLLLKPDDGERDALVVGWIDVSNRSAELRTYESLRQYAQERFGRAPDLTIDEYAELHLALAPLLTREHICLTLVPAAVPEPAPAEQVAPASPSGGRVLFWLIGLVTGLGLGFAIFGV